MLLIYNGSSPTPRDPEAWATLSEDEQNAVYRDYQEIIETPGVETGPQIQGPEAAKTVRVEDGKTVTEDGPAGTAENALSGYLVLEADDLDAAIELAARIPAARLGGAVEVRPVAQW